MDRGITSLRGGAAEHEGGAPKTRRVREYVPPVLSPEQAADLASLKPFLRAIEDANRLAILQELAREDGLSVLDLSDRLMLSQPLTSWHLHILKRARLVAPTRLGRQRIYRLNREQLRAGKELFERVLGWAGCDGG